MFAYLGLILVAITWLSGAFMIAKWHDESRPTISRHVAGGKMAYWLFATVLVVSGLLFYVWFINWLSPRLGLSMEFKAILTLTIIGQMITAVIPDTGKHRKLVHDVAASTMSVLYIPLDALILAAPRLSIFAHIVVSVAGIYMVGALVWVVILNRNRDKFLIFQALYIMAFQVAIMAAAYL